MINSCAAYYEETNPVIEYKITNPEKEETAIESPPIDESPPTPINPQSPSIPQERNYARGRIVVGFEYPIKNEADATTLINSYGLEIIDYYETMNMASVKVLVGKESEYVDKLSKDPKIKWAELDYIAQIA